jgi:hypothetical protein
MVERRLPDTNTQSRIAVLENEVRNVVEELKEFRKEQKDNYSCLMQKFDNISTRINVLEKWRWMIFGGAIVVGYILAHIRIDKLF